MTPEQRMHLDEWIGALRSGQYRQLRGRLVNGDGTKHCCLGVLCEVAGLRRGNHDLGGRGVGCFYRSPTENAIWDGTPASWWFAEYTGLPQTGTMQGLVRMNDDGCMSFDDIADEIKKMT